MTSLDPRNFVIHDPLIVNKPLITALGTSAKGFLGIKNNTAPSTSPADMFQAYSADQVAGNACPFIRTENGAIVKIFQGALIADATGGAIIDSEARTALNALLARIRAHGLIAT